MYPFFFILELGNLDDEFIVVLGLGTGEISVILFTVCLLSESINKYLKNICYFFINFQLYTEKIYWLAQPAAELQYGKVSAEELVQAVHEMLTTAGINVDIERQSLLQKTITLQEQLKDSQAALLLEQVCVC